MAATPTPIASEQPEDIHMLSLCMNSSYFSDLWKFKSRDPKTLKEFVATALFPPGMDAAIRKQTISTLANLAIDANLTEKQQVMNVLNGLYGPIKLGQSHHVEAFLGSPILRKTVEIWWLALLRNYPIVGFLDVIAK